MKKLSLVTAILCVFIHNVAFSQDVKFDDMHSASGKIVKYQDVGTPFISLKGLEVIETRARYVYNENVVYCCLIKYPCALSLNPIVHTEWIKYVDLVQLNKAIERLLKEAELDKTTQPIFLVNEYRTTDGFTVGYEIENTFVNWYIDFGRKFYTEKIIVKNGKNLADVFLAIQAKIEELQQLHKIP